jgi:hypothetical protein
MMKKLSVWMLLFALFVPVAAGTLELTVDDVTMTFDVPDGWQVETNPRTGKPLLSHPAGKASLSPVPTPGPTTKLKYELPGITRARALKQTLVQSFGPMVEQMGGGEPEALPIPGSDPEAFYISYTYGPPGGRETVIGITFVAGEEIIMMASAPDKSGVAELVAIMGSIGVKP